jgi:hypothetical protein
LKHFSLSEVIYVELIEGDGVELDFEQVYKEHFSDVYKYALSLAEYSFNGYITLLCAIL